MTEPLFTVEGVSLTGFGLGCLLAMIVYLISVGLWCHGARQGYGTFIRMAVLTIPLAWLCSRLTFVLCDFAGAVANASKYIDSWGSALLGLRFWDGGYSLMGAVIGAILAARLAEKWVQPRPRGALLDACGYALALGILVERICERGAGLGYGRETTAAWLISSGLCVEVDGVLCHPVYLYEAVAATVIFLMLVIRYVAMARPRVPGDVLRSFLMLFGLSQIALESLRDDQHMVVHFVRAQQVIALIFALSAMISWTRRMCRDGAHKGLAVAGWLLTIAAVGGMVAAEFGVDRWGNRLLAYGLLGGCLLVVFCFALAFRSRAVRTA